jgi:predicted  nucleic acid-binding Zn-ribbon protein
MAARKKKVTLESIASTLNDHGKILGEHGKVLKEHGDMLEHVVEHMATKEDIAELRHELKGDIASVQTQANAIERHLRETKTETRLADLEEKVFGASRA